MLERFFERHVRVAHAECPRETGARRGNRFESEPLENLRAADVPGIRQEEDAGFVKLVECFDFAHLTSAQCPVPSVRARAVLIVIPSVARDLEGRVGRRATPPPGFLATLGMTKFTSSP